ncbi:hypothetical protein [Cellulomonas sp. Marseille-Q8402]
MLQRLIAALLGVLGIAAIGLGVASATVWRADDPLVATAAPGGDVRTLVTDPGVLELAGDPVTVTVRAEGSPVVLAVGRDTDVTAWVGDDPYERVTGLSDWHTLATTAVEPEAAPTAAPTTEAPADAAATPSPSASGEPEASAVRAADPTGSDMWVLEVGGDGSATLDWPAQDGRWSLIAVSLGDTAPTLDLSWPQTVTTPWLWPGVALGVLLLAVAAILLVRILRARREGPDAGWHPVTTGTFATIPAPAGTTAPVPAGAAPAGEPQPTSGHPTGAIPVGTVGVSQPTRRQIREAEAAAAAAAAAERRRGRRTPTGSVPAVTGATPVVEPAVTGATPVVEPAAPTPTAPTPAAPVSGPEPAPEPDQPSPPRRGLGARLPWRKGTTERPADGTTPSTADAPAAPAAPTPSGTTTSWSPTPAPAARPAAPAGPTAPAAPAPVAPAPVARPTPAASAPPAPTPARPGSEDDPAARAQRADAWRRMWGFPSDEGGGTGREGDAAPEDDTQSRKDDR